MLASNASAAKKEWVFERQARIRLSNPGIDMLDASVFD
jgi:hypothetical protein